MTETIIHLCAVPPAGDCASSSSPLNDRWLEGDFRFFDKDNPALAADAFFERFSDYFAGAKDGIAGIMINVGWFADVVLAYPGRLDDSVPLAVFKPLFGENTGQTLGDDIWTYGQIAGVVSAIREAARRHLGREDFRVGLMLLGWTSIYYAHTPVWFRKHPESFRWGRTSHIDPACKFLDWASRLRPDSARFAAFPDGIPGGTPLPDFFAAQWARLSADVGFDTINLRDGMLGLSNYRHASPAWDPECFAGLRTLLREIKRLSPQTMTIGYSVAGSALSELRCHSFDLRTLAKDGTLDAWITQSWGCNWIEQKRLELTPAMQVAIILGHRALLEGTGVKHYPVINMLDAYEFLTCKTFTDRWQAVRWEIWAYTHAALVRYWDPEGTWGLREGAPLSLASGLYGAWFHVRDEMLGAQESAMLSREIDAAVADARSLASVGGPNMVVHDDFARRCNTSADPHAYHGEHIDETVGLLIRAGIPILSTSRILERDYSKNTAPLILHNPTGLPLDFAEDLRKSPLALVVGTPATTAGFDAPKWNPVESLDPLGDGRFLKTQLMPPEISRIVSEISSRAGGPRISAAPEACIHFHYWRTSDGSLRILLGNIDAGAQPARFDLIFDKAWMKELGITRPMLCESDACIEKRMPQDCGSQSTFSIEMAANLSLVFRVGDAHAAPLHN
jgi:hypothetical protein